MWKMWVAHVKQCLYCVVAVLVAKSSFVRRRNAYSWSVLEFGKRCLSSEVGISGTGYDMSSKDAYNMRELNSFM